MTLFLSLLRQKDVIRPLLEPRRFPCQEKKCPQMDNSPFSINYIQRRNQMRAQYSEASLDHIPSIFDQFLLELPAITSASPSMFSDSRFKKEIQVYSEREAREVLMRLIEKSKASAQRKNWKVDETNYLLFVIDRYCQGHQLRCEQLGLLDWIDISRLIPNRDSSACQFRYLSLFPKSISNVPWSSYERQLLLRIIQNQNSNCLNWKIISQRLYEESQEKTYRTGKQCREHYTCFLKPNLKKGAWTDQQDYSLICLFLKLGKKWSKMTKFIQGRNQNSIKNRFFLMFENKKDVRLTNSDLVKMARRRKEKLQKKIQVTQQPKYNDEDVMVMSPTNTDSSNFQFQPQDEAVEEAPKTRTESQIFFAEQPEEPPAAKIEEMHMFMTEEFEKYIDL